MYEKTADSNENLTEACGAYESNAKTGVSAFSPVFVEQCSDKKQRQNRFSVIRFLGLEWLDYEQPGSL